MPLLELQRDLFLCRATEMAALVTSEVDREPQSVHSQRGSYHIRHHDMPGLRAEEQLLLANYSYTWP